MWRPQAAARTRRRPGRAPLPGKVRWSCVQCTSSRQMLRSKRLVARQRPSPQHRCRYSNQWRQLGYRDRGRPRRLLRSSERAGVGQGVVAGRTGAGRSSARASEASPWTLACVTLRACNASNRGDINEIIDPVQVMGSGRSVSGRAPWVMTDTQSAKNRVQRLFLGHQPTSYSSFSF